MKKVISIIKKELMLTVAVIAAVISLIITPPDTSLIKNIDWHTLGTLFMMLCVLEGFKKEKIFNPLIKFGGNFHHMVSISLFLVFGVFFTSMFVTNDVSLIIFVPLTIMLFRNGNKEKYILPVITMENVAAIRGSLLMPFGSPQNLFIYSKSGYSAGKFIMTMAPLCIISGILIILFIVGIYALYGKNVKEQIHADGVLLDTWDKKDAVKRVSYILLFALVIWTIVSRTKYWPYAVLVILVTICIVDISILKRVDYVLLLTFLCFFVFSSQIASNTGISTFLSKSVAGHEYVWSIGLSQIISNVPASIVLFPFTDNIKALLYGADSAGLVSIIGSLASVINYRIYVREYPKNGGKFMKVFTGISLLFFAIVVIPGYLWSR